MARVRIYGRPCFPPLPTTVSGSPNKQVAAIDAADEGLASIVSAPKDGNITHIGWATGTVTTGATIEVRVETIDYSSTPAIPSGTLFGTNTNGTTVIADTDDNIWVKTALTASATVTRGQKVAVVIKQPNTSFGNMNVGTYSDNSNVDFPYNLLNTGVSPAVSWAAHGSSPILALYYSDGTVEVPRGCSGFYNVSSISIGTGSTPDVYALRFQVNRPMVVDGAWTWVDADGAYDVKIVTPDYNQSTGAGVLASASRPLNERRSTNPSIAYIGFTSDVILLPGNWYRLIIEPTSATTIVVYDFLYDSEVFPVLDGGVNWHTSTAKDPTGDASWTNLNSGSYSRLACGISWDEELLQSSFYGA